MDKNGSPKLLVQGHWDEYVGCAPVISSDGKRLETGDFRELWRVEQRPSVKLIFL